MLRTCSFKTKSPFPKLHVHYNNTHLIFWNPVDSNKEPDFIFWMPYHPHTQSSQEVTKKALIDVYHPVSQVHIFHSPLSFFWIVPQGTDMVD